MGRKRNFLFQCGSSAAPGGLGLNFASHELGLSGCQSLGSCFRSLQMLLE